MGLIKNLNETDIPAPDECDVCSICGNPPQWCEDLPVIEIYIEDNCETTHNFEEFEDMIAELFTVQGISAGRIECRVTGNTTTFPQVEE